MQHKTHTRLFLLTLALFAWVLAFAQFPNNPCNVGPTQRTALVNLQKATVVEGWRAGQIPLSDTCGNQYYQQYVEVNLTPIVYTPTTAGNTQNLSEFVVDPGGILWYIDWQGNATQFGPGNACDEDFLQISDNSCPDALTDSIYKYNYVSIGARGVWPDAELLVNDSSAVGVAVVSGNRNSRIILHDNQNDTWSVWDQGGSTTSNYVEDDGLWKVSTATGPPQNVGVLVDHFAVNTADSTIVMYLYPNTREDTSGAVNFLYTDPDGIVQSGQLANIIPGYVTNIYNSDGNITGVVNRSVNIDELTFLDFNYPNGNKGIEIYGGDDSTAAGGYSGFFNPLETAYFLADGSGVNGQFSSANGEAISIQNSDDGLTNLYISGSQTNLLQSLGGGQIGIRIDGTIPSVHLEDDSNGNEVGLESSIGSGLIVKLGGALPASGQILRADGNGTFQFATPAAGGIYGGSGSIPVGTDATALDEFRILYNGAGPAIDIDDNSAHSRMFLYSGDGDTKLYVENNVISMSTGAGASIVFAQPGLIENSITGVIQYSATQVREDSVRAINTNGAGTADIAVKGGEIAMRTNNANQALYIRAGSGTTINGNLGLSTVGGKLNIATGSNAIIGTATLSSGTVTVNTTAVTSSSIIYLTCNTPGGTQGFLSAPVGSIVNGTSFTINSSSGSDASTVNWLCIN